MQKKTIIVAGATGDLGTRVAKALSRKGAIVRAVVRKGSSSIVRARLAADGVLVLESDYDPVSLKTICQGADCVVSVLNGLEDVILGQQGALVDAAIAAGVPRFIPSDFSLDYTKTVPGENRNMDLRRRFRNRVDGAPIKATSILNGAFSTVLTQDAPIILPRLQRVLYWGRADQTLNFTSKDDVADYTADVALDDDPPRDLRIAGASASPRELSTLASNLSGKPYRLLRAGSIKRLGFVIGLTRRLAPSPGQVFPAWQGMQYLRDMMSGRGELWPLDNQRYGKPNWTTIEALVAEVI